MGFGTVGHLIAHARGQREFPAIAQLRDELALQDQEHVPAAAPVVGGVSGAVLDLPHPNVADLAGAADRLTGHASVLDRLDLAPVGDGEWHSFDLHDRLT